MVNPKKMIFPVRSHATAVAFTPGPPEVLYTNEELDAAKEGVGEVGLKYGPAAWRSAMACVDPLSTLTHDRTPHVASRAYYKLVELVDHLPLKPCPPFLHLCDAPGGFVQAAFDMYGGPWVAHSLQKGPTGKHTEATAESGVASAVASAAPGASPTAAAFKNLPPDGQILKLADRGDLLCEVPFQQLINLTRFGPYKQYGLVTADGSVDFEHAHASAEVQNLHLILRQALIAKTSLAQGGCFILKLFDCRTTATLGMIELIAGWFERTKIVKPQTSRPTNGEKYLVCSGFCVCNTPIAPPNPSISLRTVTSELHSETIKDVLRAEASFADAQRKSIELAFKAVRGAVHPRNNANAWLDTHGKRFM